MLNFLDSITPSAVKSAWAKILQVPQNYQEMTGQYNTLFQLLIFIAFAALLYWSARMIRRQQAESRLWADIKKLNEQGVSYKHIPDRLAVTGKNSRHLRYLGKKRGDANYVKYRKDAIISLLKKKGIYTKSRRKLSFCNDLEIDAAA